METSALTWFPEQHTGAVLLLKKIANPSENDQCLYEMEGLFTNEAHSLLQRVEPRYN